MEDLKRKISNRNLIIGLLVVVILIGMFIYHINLRLYKINCTDDKRALKNELDMHRENFEMRDKGYTDCVSKLSFTSTKMEDYKFRLQFIKEALDGTNMGGPWSAYTCVNSPSIININKDCKAFIYGQFRLAGIT